MFVTGKPGWSKGYFTFRLFKPGVKRAHVPMPKESERIGDKDIRKKITSTYREVHRFEHGGKGTWLMRVYPHFDREIGADPSLKYGAVVVVESTRNLSVYNQIANWMARPETVLEPKKGEERQLELPVESRAPGT